MTNFTTEYRPQACATEADIGDSILLNLLQCDENDTYICVCHYAATFQAGGNQKWFCSR